MNAAILLKHYARIADAPDAILRLRRFVLDLAVRGKLVEQDAKDEPASKLLERVATEKARLVKIGSVRNRAALPAVTPQEAPYSLPSSWMWVRFANIVEFYAGRTPARNDLSYWNTGDHAWVSIGDMEDGGIIQQTKETVSDIARAGVFKSEPEPVGTMVMSFKLTIGKISRLGVPAFHNEAIVSIHPYLSALDGYLFMSLPELARAGDTKGAIKGATLNRDSLSNILVPLPPLAEQHRIVAKVDELMALCDRLEAARVNREAARDTFALSTLAKLNTPDPETFGDDACFALSNLAPLTTRPEQIKHLRQTILNLAVCGRLVESETSMRQSVLGQVGKFVGGSGFPKQFQGKQDLEIPFLKVSDMNLPGNERLISTANNYVSRDDLRAMRAKVHPAGTIIFPKIGGAIATNKRRILGCPAAIDNNCAGQVPNDDIDVDWLYLVLSSIDMAAYQAGTAVPALNMKQLAEHPVAIPPKSEQHRIVARVDELMALCDQLEASLTTGEQTRSRLLEAFLHNALEPA